MWKWAETNGKMCGRSQMKVEFTPILLIQQQKAKGFFRSVGDTEFKTSSPHTCK